MNKFQVRFTFKDKNKHKPEMALYFQKIIIEIFNCRLNENGIVIIIIIIIT